MLHLTTLQCNDYRNLPPPPQHAPPKPPKYAELPPPPSPEQESAKKSKKESMHTNLNAASDFVSLEDEYDADRENDNVTDDGAAGPSQQV